MKTLTGHNSYSKWALTGQNRGLKTAKQNKQSTIDRLKHRLSQKTFAPMSTNAIPYTPWSIFSYSRRKSNKYTPHVGKKQLAKLAIQNN